MSEDYLEKPVVLVIFGITGDLAQRYILPSLYKQLKAGNLPEALHIVGISRRDVSVTDVYRNLPESIADSDFDELLASQLTGWTEMVQMDLDDRAAYERLNQRLAQLEADMGPAVSRLYYLSVPPETLQPIVRLLGETGHNASSQDGATLPRLLVEKPFGSDLASAEQLVQTVTEHFAESQVYRIDHYVAKEIVQDVLAVRFRNPLFADLWQGAYIDAITIAAYEKIDIEGRATFYEQTGALRDLVQSHLLQLLAITAMEPPAQLTSEAIHAAKLQLLDAVRPADPANAVRGQYEGYREEVQNPESNVETYARIGLTIDNERWRNVSVTLETGKALERRETFISLCFKGADNTPHNKLIFRVTTNEGIAIELQTKKPGIGNEVVTKEMVLDYNTAFDERLADGYERVLIDAIRGIQTLFTSSAEVLAAWKIVQPLLDAWENNPGGLEPYAKGSTGPSR